MEINKKHPKYLEYIRKCEELTISYREKVNTERAKFPDWVGLDHPSDEEVNKLLTEMKKKLKKLKKEYHYLFN